MPFKFNLWRYIKAGGVGLNLTAASRVVMLDNWWNPQTEQQAFERCHRIGQTRQVVVHRLYVAGLNYVGPIVFKRLV